MGSKILALIHRINFVRHLSVLDLENSMNVMKNFKTANNLLLIEALQVMNACFFLHWKMRNKTLYAPRS